MHGSAMILAAERGRIHQPDAALLARRDDVFLALVIEDWRRRREIEVAFAHPVGIDRRVPILQFKRFRLLVLLHADERLPVDLLRREVVAVAAARVDGAVLADRWPGSWPQSTAPRRP